MPPVAPRFDSRVDFGVFDPKIHIFWVKVLVKLVNMFLIMDRVLMMIKWSG
jgi:hypothetical protein